MKSNLVGFSASMVLGLMATSVTAFSKTSANDAHLTVLLYDFVNLPAGERNELKATSKWILGHAGVTVEFIECLAGGVKTGALACAGTLGPTDAILRILPPALAKEGDWLGWVTVGSKGGAYISVFPRTILADGLTTGALLGHATAHEVGHLLLGTNAHSSYGIMRPRMGQSDEQKMRQGRVLFDAGQADRMRRTLAARAGR